MPGGRRRACSAWRYFQGPPQVHLDQSPKCRPRRIRRMVLWACHDHVKRPLELMHGGLALRRMIFKTKASHGAASFSVLGHWPAVPGKLNRLPLSLTRSNLRMVVRCVLCGLRKLAYVASLDDREPRKRSQSPRRAPLSSAESLAGQHQEASATLPIATDPLRVLQYSLPTTLSADRAVGAPRPSPRPWTCLAQDFRTGLLATPAACSVSGPRAGR